jgi:hypothetical protein
VVCTDGVLLLPLLLLLLHPLLSRHSHKDLAKDAAPHFRKAKKFYDTLASEMVSHGHICDIFSCALDNVSGAVVGNTCLGVLNAGLICTWSVAGTVQVTLLSHFLWSCLSQWKPQQQALSCACAGSGLLLKPHRGAIPHLPCPWTLNPTLLCVSLCRAAPCCAVSSLRSCRRACMR